MRSSKVLVVLLSVAAMSAAAFGQAAGAGAPPQPAAAPMPPAEPVLSHIPAGAMGFAVVNNLQSGTEKLDKFLGDIGLGEMVKASLPEGTLSPIRGLLGAGFNPNGGVAVVMLDVQQYGVDVMELIQGRRRPRPAAGDAPATQPAAAPKLPVVFFVAGKGIKEVFSNFELIEPTGDSKYATLLLPPGPMFAATVGGYVIVSPNDKALTAIIESKTPVAKELSADVLAKVSKADLAIHVNMTVTGPLLNKMIQQAEQQIAQMKQMMAQGGGGPMPSMGPMGMMMGVGDLLPMYRDALSQIQGVTITAGFAKTGLLIEETVAWSPESKIGKSLASMKPPADKLVDRLPDLPYVLAVGAGWQNNQEITGTTMDMLAKLLGGVDEELRSRTLNLVKAFYDQVSGLQLVAGGAPKGSGLFGVAFVLKCKDSGTVKGLLAEKAAISKDLLKSFLKGMMGPRDLTEFDQLQIAYAKDVEKVDELSVDAVTIEHPELANMSDRDKEEMTKVLGDSKIRLLVAAPDKNTVVVTFGGSKTFLAETIAAAKAAKGTILADAAAAEAMAHMPKNLCSLALFNGGNLFQVILDGAKVMEPDSPPPPFNINCKTPIAMGVGVSGSTENIVFYVPSELIKQAVGAFMQVAGPRRGPMPVPAEPAPGSEDF